MISSDVTFPVMVADSGWKPVMLQQMEIKIQSNAGNMTVVVELTFISHLIIRVIA
jgi:hypothetical protein